MKKFVLTAMLLAAAAVPALAAESIGIYEDQTALDCEIADGAAGLKTVWIVHTNSLGSTGSRFTLDSSASTMTYLSGTPVAPILSIGATNTGVSLAYTECKTGTFPIVQVSYFASGTTAACSKLRLIDEAGPPPGHEIADCTFFAFTFTPGVGVVNANVTCPCDVSTQTSTWGTIKALYH